MKLKAYKLTDINGRTRGGMQWGIGIENTATGKGTILCSDGYIHGYVDAVLAVLMNPVHGKYDPFRMWEIEYSGKTIFEPLKFGAKTVKTIREITPPTVTTNQRIAFGILCAMEVYTEPKFVKWAKNWLNGTDRSRDAAIAIEKTDTAIYGATYTAIYAAVYKADTAYAADAVAHTAYAKPNIDFVRLAHKALKYQ